METYLSTKAAAGAGPSDEELKIPDPVAEVALGAIRCNVTEFVAPEPFTLIAPGNQVMLSGSAKVGEPFLDPNGKVLGRVLRGDRDDFCVVLLSATLRVETGCVWEGSAPW